ncbi:MAG TPA: helix-turn-helix domain-containing protein [Solirubrobacterales bacterium]|nr:helix-turn-helix domain-containing protein [Solirubrobacterales bacterium]
MSGLGQEDKWVLKDWTLGERFGANLVWFRRQAGLTQQALADRAGMKRTVLSKIERGRQLPRLDTTLKLVAGLEVKNCDLVAWMWWDPGRHHHYESAPSDASGYEVLDFDLPAGFRISPVGYESEKRFKDRLRQRVEEDWRVLELLRDDAPKVAPRERSTAAWVLRTGEALKALREERGLTHDQLAERSPTTATFIREIEEGRIGDPGLRILEEISRALDGEGSALAAQIEPVRAAQKAAVQEVLDELVERDARLAERKG